MIFHARDDAAFCAKRSCDETAYPRILAHILQMLKQFNTLVSNVNGLFTRAPQKETRFFVF
jgi:hypothetical protein